MSFEVIISICSVVLLLLYIVMAYNDIFRSKSALVRAWSVVLVQERQKEKILKSLEVVVDKASEFESHIQEKITELRGDISKLSSQSIDQKQLSKVENKTAELLKGFSVSVEAYPGLKSHGLFQSYMNEITHQHSQVGAAIRMFSEHVESFNNMIGVFPSSVVNRVLNKESMVDNFHDQSASKAFDYSPKL